MRSSYRLKSGARTAIGSEQVPTGNYDGYYVQDYVGINRCQACPNGYSNEAGDELTGFPTRCMCAMNYHVDENNACVGCGGGTTHAAGDEKTTATTCDATLCLVNEFAVGDGSCDACGAGKLNAAGDDADPGSAVASRSRVCYA